MHIVLSVVLLAELLSTIDSLRDKRQAQLDRVSQLERNLDDDLFEKLMKTAVVMRPAVERDGCGLTELEFAVTMLVQADAPPAPLTVSPPPPH